MGAQPCPAIALAFFEILLPKEFKRREEDITSHAFLI